MVNEDSVLTPPQASPPTPACVGREFVRQYYTMLHEAPHHLHRFYNNESAFVRGVNDPTQWKSETTVGQASIQKKLQEMNLESPYARIRTVESHKTVGDAVVVLVCGELSLNQGPMRQFVQTFVLAPQAPKKYYVHNDVFQYNDETFGFTLGENEQQPPDDQIEGSEYPDEVLSNGNHRSDLSSSATPAETTVDHEAPYLNPMPQRNPRASAEHRTPSSVPMESSKADEYDSAPHYVNDASKLQGGENVSGELGVQIYATDDVSTAPMSWANVVQPGGQAGRRPGGAPGQPGGGVVGAAQDGGGPQQQQQRRRSDREQPPPQQSQQEGGGYQHHHATISKTPSYLSQDVRYAGGSVQNAGGGVDRRDRYDGGGSQSYYEARQQNNSTNQDVFIRKVPQDMNEQEIREIFGVFGKIREVKLTHRQGGGEDKLGFVSYETHEAAEKCIQKPPEMPLGSYFSVDWRNFYKARGGSMVGPQRGGRGGPPMHRGGGGPRMEFTRGGGNIRGNFIPRGRGRGFGGDRGAMGGSGDRGSFGGGSGR